MSDQEITYASAGVDIDAADESVKRIKEHVRSTFRPEVIGDVGAFGGLFAFDPKKYDAPVLVSGTDGVGTKSVIAQLTGRYDTIGIDLVATCTDDLVCQGAETLFFLDYISVGKMDPDMMDKLVEGVSLGCRQAGCALVGGEMSEHPGLMEVGEFDLVGFAVGVVDRAKMLGPHKVELGDAIIGIPSPGIRCNGYSLARKIFLDIDGRDLDAPAWEGSAHSIGEELLRPSAIYAPAVLELLKKVNVHSAAHITGGGIVGNIPRALPEGASAVIELNTWERPRIFDEIQRIGKISDEEMFRTFNMGVGMALIVGAEDAHKTIDELRLHGHRVSQIGEVVKGTGEVSFI